MSKHIVIDKQNAIDVALMRHGHIDAVFELIANNEISLHEPILPGTEVEYNDSSESVLDEDVLAYYKKNKLEPVTDLEDFESEINWEFIDTVDFQFIDGVSLDFLN